MQIKDLGSPYLILVFFGGTFLLCHLRIFNVILHHKCVIENTYRWAIRCEILDFIYLGLAAVALVPAAFEVNHYLVKKSLKENVYDQSYMLTYTKDVFARLKAYPRTDKSDPFVQYVTNAEKSLILADARLEAARALIGVEQYDRGMELLETAISDFEDFRRLPLPPKEAVPASAVRDLEDLGSIETSHGIHARSLLERTQYAKSTRQSETFLFLTPMLLAVGLAVRCTKTSGKLLLEYQKRLGATNKTTPPAAVNPEPVVPPTIVATPEPAKPRPSKKRKWKNR